MARTRLKIPHVIEMQRHFCYGLVLAATLAGLSGCGAVSAASSRPKPEPMPPNAQWQGVYQGPYHIQLEIETRGNQATGSWRAIGGREGQFSGTVSGNLLVLDYTENGVTSSEAWSGRGYFVYQTGTSGADEISGEWGLGQGGGRSEWWALKRTNAPLSTAKLVDNDSQEDEPSDAPQSGGCTVGCDAQDTEPE
jgi:hypothetical protein